MKENLKNPLYQYKQTTGQTWLQMSYIAKISAKNLQALARHTRETAKLVRLETAWNLKEKFDVDMFNTDY